MDAAQSAVSVLFVPGSRPDRFRSALTAGADLVLLDLEDSVTPEDKDQARADVDRALRGGAVGGVRINGAATPWHRADVEAVAATAAAVMVPKAEAGAGLTELAARLAAVGTPVIALIETAAGVVDAAAIARTAGVTRLAFGSLDLAADLRIDALDHEIVDHARFALVLASAAAGLPAPLDGVWAEVRDDDGLRAETARARRLGFGGKLCVHPRQIPVVHDGFRPTDAETTWARDVLAAYEREGRAGVFVLDGAMVDKPILDRARRIVERST